MYKERNEREESESNEYKEERNNREKNISQSEESSNVERSRYNERKNNNKNEERSLTEELRMISIDDNMKEENRNEENRDEENGDEENRDEENRNEENRNEENKHDEKNVKVKHNIDEEDRSTDEEEKLHDEEYIRNNRKKEKEISEEQNSERRATLYVSNIATHVSESELIKVFEPFGHIVDCRIITNPITKESRGFAFISYGDNEPCRKAYKRLDGYRLAGKRIRIERAKRNRPYDPTPGHYYGPPGASIKYGTKQRGRTGHARYRSPYRGAASRTDYFRPHFSRYQADSRTGRGYDNGYDASPMDDYEYYSRHSLSHDEYTNNRHGGSHHRDSRSRRSKSLTRRHKSPHGYRRSPHNSKSHTERRSRDGRYQRSVSRSLHRHKKYRR